MDLISRQAAIDALMSLTVYKSKREVVQAADKHENTWIGGVAECIDEIEDLPSAQHERKTGKWIKVKPISGVEAYMCPFCKTGDWDISVDSYNYCPYCGKSVSGVADDPSHPFVDDVMKGEENG